MACIYDTIIPQGELGMVLAVGYDCLSESQASVTDIAIGFI